MFEIPEDRHSIRSTELFFVLTSAAIAYTLYELNPRSVHILTPTSMRVQIPKEVGTLSSLPPLLMLFRAMSVGSLKPVVGTNLLVDTEEKKRCHEAKEVPSRLAGLWDS